MLRTVSGQRSALKPGMKNVARTAWRSRIRRSRGTAVRGPYSWWLMTSSWAAVSGWSKRRPLSASRSKLKQAAARIPAGQRKPGGRTNGVGSGIVVPRWYPLAWLRMEGGGRGRAPGDRGSSAGWRSPATRAGVGWDDYRPPMPGGLSRNWWSWLLMGWGTNGSAYGAACWASMLTDCGTTTGAVIACGSPLIHS